MLRARGIKSILDAPCGDAHWIPEVVAECGLQYVGLDIVEDLITTNRLKLAHTGMQFQVGDIICDLLPAVDCVLCRDCLVHLSNEEIGRALDNIHKSGARYLLATTFPKCSVNIDVITGMWRPTNLNLRPFLLPDPEELIFEGSKELNSEDKSLGLFDLRKWDRARLH